MAIIMLFMYTLTLSTQMCENEKKNTVTHTDV